MGVPGEQARVTPGVTNLDTGAGLAVDAPAKLNLSLAVLGRRPDGYHELAGVMVLLELADRLRLRAGPSGLRLVGIAAEGVPREAEANLAWRGLLAGAGHGAPAPCLELEKRIPAAAGLGGGSSDAAAGWRLGRHSVGRSDVPNGAELAALASLGADVPFFAAGHATAVVSGIGELVRPLDPPWHGDAVEPPAVVLVHPPFRLGTSEVFAETRPADWSSELPLGEPAPGRNDLLPAALRLRPDLDAIAAAMRSAGLEPHLTGSGPTLFAITADAERADVAAAALRHSGLATSVTRLRRRAASIEPATTGERAGG
jgi:4-diphosphocytidyl-2-C-methyl-D-erythritol kinase